MKYKGNRLIQKQTPKPTANSHNLDEFITEDKQDKNNRQNKTPVESTN